MHRAKDSVLTGAGAVVAVVAGEAHRSSRSGAADWNKHLRLRASGSRDTASEKQLNMNSFVSINQRKNKELKLEGRF